MRLKVAEIAFFLFAATGCVWAQGQPPYTTTEYNAYNLAHNEKDPQQGIQLLDAFVCKYPTSFLLPYVYRDYYHTYYTLKNYPQVIEYADDLLASKSQMVDLAGRLEALVARAQAYSAGQADPSLQSSAERAKARFAAAQGLVAIGQWQKPKDMDGEQFAQDKQNFSILFNDVIRIADSVHATAPASAPARTNSACVSDDTRQIEVAAAAGNVQAETNLALMYGIGQGVPEDNEKAAYWYQKAAEAGDAGAEFTLGHLYENGQGVPRSNEKALYWYQKSADQGLGIAKQNLAQLQQSIAKLRGAPEEAESDRQDKIQEWQEEIESAQTQAQDDDERAANMQQQADQYASQGGVGAISAGIGYAAAAKFRDNAQAERQKIADLTSQIQQSQRESAAAAREQASQQEAAATAAVGQNGPPGLDSSQPESQQAAQEQAQQDESDRQSKIQELQGELESKQKMAEMYDGNAADLRRQQAATSGQPGGAAAASVLQIGIDKFDQDAQQARQEASGIQSQLNALRGQQSNSSPDSNALALTQANSSGGSGTYTGPNADWVHRLLGRVGTWSCPSSPIAQDGVPPQVQTGAISMRDQYVKTAVLEAWAAECYARQQRDNEAQDQAAAMMKTLETVQSLCGNGGALSNGPTDGIFRCGELPGGGGGTAVGQGPVPPTTRGPAPAGTAIQPSKCPDSRPCARSAQ